VEEFLGEVVRLLFHNLFTNVVGREMDR